MQINVIAPEHDKKVQKNFTQISEWSNMFPGKIALDKDDIPKLIISMIELIYYISKFESITIPNCKGKQIKF